MNISSLCQTIEKGINPDFTKAEYIQIQKALMLCQNKNMRRKIYIYLNDGILKSNLNDDDVFCTDHNCHKCLGYKKEKGINTHGFLVNISFSERGDGHFKSYTYLVKAKTREQARYRLYCHCDPEEYGHSFPAFMKMIRSVRKVCSCGTG